MTVFKSRSFCYAKDPENPDQNQDAFQISEKLGMAVVADGVSSAIFSAAWAKILTRSIIEDQPNPEMGAEFAQWLTQKRLEWEQSIDGANLAWFQRPKMAAGAFSTLIWVKVREIVPPKPNTPQWQKFKMSDEKKRCFHVCGHCIGDSCLFHVRPGSVDSEIVPQSDLYRSIPIRDLKEFEASPVVVGSKDLGRDRQMKFQKIDFLAQEGDLVVLATDAVSQWILKSYVEATFPRWDLFWDLKKDVWESELDAMRAAGEIRYDDSTLLLLQMGSSDEFLNSTPDDLTNAQFENQTPESPTLAPLTLDEEETFESQTPESPTLAPLTLDEKETFESQTPESPTLAPLTLDEEETFENQTLDSLTLEGQNESVDLEINLETATGAETFPKPSANDPSEADSSAPFSAFCENVPQTENQVSFPYFSQSFEGDEEREIPGEFEDALLRRKRRFDSCVAEESVAESNEIAENDRAKQGQTQIFGSDFQNRSSAGTTARPGFHYRMASSASTRTFQSAKENQNAREQQSARTRQTARRPTAPNQASVSETPSPTSPSVANQESMNPNARLAENWQQIRESATQIAEIFGEQMSEKMNRLGSEVNRVGNQLNEGVAQFGQNAKPKIQGVAQRLSGWFKRKEKNESDVQEEDKEKSEETKPVRVIDPNRRRFYNPPPRE